MLALSTPWVLAAAVLVVAVMTALFWSPLFSREARDRRRRGRNYRRVSSNRGHERAVQLNLEVPKKERDPKR